MSSKVKTNIAIHCHHHLRKGNFLSEAKIQDKTIFYVKCHRCHPGERFLHKRELHLIWNPDVLKGFLKSNVLFRIVTVLLLNTGTEVNNISK